MARPVKGEIVVIPFPFSDLITTKRCPALVLAISGGDDVIMCQITSQSTGDPNAIPLVSTDFASGTLKRDSFIRPGKLFTFDTRLITYSVGHLKTDKRNEVLEAVRALF